MNEDFQDVLSLLLEHDADFIVVGAHAMAVHGAARATGDIDVFVRPSHANAERVCSALLAFGAPLVVAPQEPRENGETRASDQR